MPGNTPLTQTPYATLDDSPNIEAAGKNGFKFIERFAIPRFASTSERNIAFLNSESSPPVVDQLCSVNGMLYVWDGSSWIDFRHYYHILTTVKARKAHDTSRGVSSFTNDDELTVAIPHANSTYLVDAFFFGQGSTGADMKYRLSFPAGCEFSGGPISGALDMTDPQSVPNMYLSGTIAMTDPSAVFWVMPVSPVAIGLVNYSTTRFMGTLEVGATVGNLTIQWGQNVADAVTYTTMAKGSWLRIEEF